MKASVMSQEECQKRYPHMKLVSFFCYHGTNAHAFAYCPANLSQGVTKWQSTVYAVGSLLTEQAMRLFAKRLENLSLYHFTACTIVNMV